MPAPNGGDDSRWCFVESRVSGRNPPAELVAESVVFFTAKVLVRRY
jgi:hypothetical protein